MYKVFGLLSSLFPDFWEPRGPRRTISKKTKIMNTRYCNDTPIVGLIACRGVFYWGT
jgi:hypothetical protein